MGLAANAWERLTDEQRLIWQVTASNRRTTGRKYFISVNVRRFYRGETPLLLPPSPEVPCSCHVLQALLLTNQRGRLGIKLGVRLPPGARFTVWASRPCNAGRLSIPRCPQIGPLPPPVYGWSDLTAPYLKKHGAWISQQRLQLMGKRIFVLLRQEMDTRPGLPHLVKGLIPPPHLGPNPVKNL